MARGYIFKILAVLVLLLAGCQDIPRDNILDPGNPDSFQKSTVLAEAFVNTNNPANFNELALAGLNTLENDHSEDLIILEYHRNTSQYADPYHQPAFENLYQKYVQLNGGVGAGAPDIFISGSERRVSGASSAAGIVGRISPILEELFTRRNYFTIEKKRLALDGLTADAECLIARLGNSEAKDLMVKAAFIKNIQAPYLQRVVIHLEKSTEIPEIAAGEIYTQKFENIRLDDKPDAVVFIVSSADESVVYQALKAVFE